VSRRIVPPSAEPAMARRLRKVENSIVFGAWVFGSRRGHDCCNLASLYTVYSSNEQALYTVCGLNVAW
jgi:hypothetical protein